MASTSWRQAGTISSQTRSGGTVSWSNPSNAGASDNSYATAAISFNGSHWLRCTNFGFTESDVPAGATITGLEIRYERKQTETAAVEGPVETYLMAVKSSSEIGTQKTIAGHWENTDTVNTQGGSSDMWGTTFSDAEAIASGTGISIAFLDQDYGSTTASIDVVEIRWHYTVPSTRRHGSSSMWEKFKGLLERVGRAYDQVYRRPQWNFQ